jgi:hypothetical protein
MNILLIVFRLILMVTVGPLLILFILVSNILLGPKSDFIDSVDEYLSRDDIGY